MDTTGATNTAAGYSSPSVNIFPDSSNPQLDHVNVTATTSVPTWFIRWFGYSNINITAVGNATRRAVVVMMVLDRSHSMCMVGGSLIHGNNPCTETDTTTPCSKMISAAKQFTGQFAQGRDYIGLITFAENAYVTQVPSTTFQTTLGYSNNSGSGVGSAAGSLDNIVCNGGTGTAQAVSMAYQALYQTGLPGALNIIMLETDGLPNTLTMNFYDSVNNVAGLNNGSGCKDLNNKTIAGGGFTVPAKIPSWTSGLALNAAPFNTTSGPYSNIPAGMIGSVPSADPGGANNFFIAMQYFTNSTANSYNTNTYISTSSPYAVGCSFPDTGTSPVDIKWFPKTDVYGNNTNPSNAYQSVTTDAKGHISPNSWSNYHNAVLNATDNAAYVARANPTIPAYVFAIGLGGNSVGGPPDPVLLQRMANDPSEDQFNSPASYAACPTCATAGQYTGKFVYAPTSAELNSAFLVISSQILRLNK
jgi:von Willebrand factor type A domain